MASGPLLPASAAPEEVDRLLAQGDAEWAQNRLDAAERLYLKAQSENPASVGVHLKLGGLYLGRGQYEASRTQFQTAAGLDPRNANAFVGLGIAYLHDGSYGPAYAAFTEASRLDPSKYEDLEAVLKWLEQKTSP